MKECSEIVTQKIKKSAGRSVWLKKEIKRLENIVHPSIIEKHDMCILYRTLFHVPFSNEENLIYKYCIFCSFKPDNKELFDELHKY